MQLTVNEESQLRVNKERDINPSKGNTKTLKSKKIQAASESRLNPFEDHE